MANERGQYGSARVGQDPTRATTIYVERNPSSIGAWIIGTIIVGGAVLWARHQSRQIEQIQSKFGLPQQSFAAGLRESARALPGRASATLHEIAERVRPTRKPATKLAAAESKSTSKPRKPRSG